MPQTQYNLHLKGFVGGADFDRKYVDYILTKSAILYLFFTNTRLFSMRIALKKKHANLVLVSVLGGVREIRTPEPLLTVTRFPDFSKFQAKILINNLLSFWYLKIFKFFSIFYFISKMCSKSMP